MQVSFLPAIIEPSLQPLYEALSANALSTWQALKGPADWRTMIFKWVVEGRCSPWLREHMRTSTEKLVERDL